MRRRPVLAAGAAVFLVALVLRLVYIAQIRDNPFFTVPIIDARTYDEQARAIAAGDWLGGREVFYQAPLYPYFLAALHGLGGGYFFPRAAQALLGAASCALLFQLGRSLFGAGIGLGAGLAAAAYGPLILYDAELLRPVLVTFLVLLSLLALLRADAAPAAGSLRRWALAGLLLGLTAIARENILLFFPVVVLWMRGGQRREGGRRAWARASALLLAGAAAAILPVTARNLAVSGEAALISSQGGLNFYIGNNPEMERTVALQPGEEWEEMVRLPDRDGRLLSRAERRRWFAAEGLRFIARDPRGWLAVMARKVVYFWHGFEITPNHNPEFLRRHSPLLRALLHLDWPVIIPFGLVGPLALTGMVFTPRGRDRRLLLWFILAYAASVILFHVRARYRLPAMPVLLLFAAAGAAQLAALVRGRSWRRLAPPLALFLGLLVALNSDLFGVRSFPVLPVQRALGRALMDRGDLAGAEVRYAAALAEDPGDVEALNALGILRLARGKRDEALQLARRAVALRPQSAVSHNNLGRLLLEGGEAEAAGAEFEEAIRLNPFDPAPRSNLGALRYGQGRLAEAEARLREALELDPKNAGARELLERVLRARGAEAR